jgi:hypothetical protein
MSGLSDTSPEAQRVLTRAYLNMPLPRKLRLIGREFRFARNLHEADFRRRNPDSTPAQARDSWAILLLGRDVWSTIKKELPMDEELEQIEVIRRVTAAFETLGVAYVIGGSWASSLYGEPRMTRDADISVEPFSGNEQALAANFGEDFYLSVDAARAANRDRSCFNIIHTPTAFKVDVFVLKKDAFDQSLMSRRTARSTVHDVGAPLAWVTPEDIVLLKLRWYRRGNEISDRQWSDILGVLRIQSGKLDQAYLDHWAIDLGVNDLLIKARAEADAGDERP